MRSGPYNPAKSLIRSNFMELLIRCAIEKYVSGGHTKSELEAVQWFNANFLEPRLKKEETQNQWRKNNSFTEPVDIIVRGYKPHFEHIYQKYAGKAGHTKPG